jgi:hypothetical protein
MPSSADPQNRSVVALTWRRGSRIQVRKQRLFTMRSPWNLPGGSGNRTAGKASTAN